MDPMSSELNYPMGAKSEPLYLTNVTHLVVNLLVNNIDKEIRFENLAESKNYVTGLIDAHAPIKSYANEWVYFMKGTNGTTIRYNLVYLLGKIKQLLSQVFTMYYRKDYGIGDLMREDPKIPKNEYVAIPYSGVDSPVNGSEFSDPYLTLILTVISYVYRGLTKDNVLELINSYYLMNWKRTGFKDYVLNKVVNYEPSQLKMKLATGMWDFKLDDHDYNILKVKKECIVDFLMNIVIKNYIDVAENQYNCNICYTFIIFLCVLLGISVRNNIW